MEYTSHYNSPLGQITLASNGTCLTGLWFEGQKFFARTLANCTQEKDLPVFHQTSEWLDCYFSGKKADFTPALQMNDPSELLYGKSCNRYLMEKQLLIKILLKK